MFDNMSATTTVAIPERTRSRRTTLLAVLFVGFVLSGIATTIVGPMLPVFIRRWGRADHARNEFVRCGSRSCSQCCLAQPAQFYLGSGSNGLLAADRRGIGKQSIAQPAPQLRNFRRAAGVYASVCAIRRRKTRKGHRHLGSRTPPRRTRSDHRARNAVFHVCLHGNEYWRVVRGVLASHRKRNHKYDHARADVFLRGAYLRTRLGSARLAIPFGRTVGDWRA